jgi:hypothetical protein
MQLSGVAAAGRVPSSTGPAAVSGVVRRIERSRDRPGAGQRVAHVLLRPEGEVIVDLT